MVRLNRTDLENFIDQQVKAGRFETREAAIEAAVERMMLEEVALDEATLDAIDESEAQVQRGEHYDWNEVSAKLRDKHLRK
jgi:Arc/MetJ-type ribon-helix-helix transcriptional regulator